MSRRKRAQRPSKPEGQTTTTSPQLPTVPSQIDIEKANFVLGEVEHLLDLLVSDRDAIRKRALWLLSAIGVAIATCIKLVAETDSLFEPWSRLLLTEVALLGATGCGLVLSCLLPSIYGSRGLAPDKISPDYLGQSLSHMKMGYAKILQNPIDFNKKEISKLSKRFAVSAWIAALSPLIAYLITHHLHPWFVALVFRD